MGRYGKNNVDPEVLKLLINRITSERFRDLSDNLGDVIFLLETLFLYRDHGVYKASQIRKILDIIASEIDVILDNSKKIIINDIERSISRSISLIEKLH